MKPRKVILTIELLTNMKLNKFTKASIADVFDWVRDDDDLDVLEIHQVKAQVVKPNK